MVFEHLVAFVGKLEATIVAEQEEIEATVGAYRKATKACQGKREPCQIAVGACLENMKAEIDVSKEEVKVSCEAMEGSQPGEVRRPGNDSFREGGGQ